MAKRHRVPANRSKDKRQFTATASRQNRRNIPVRPMRGGFRL